MNQIQYIEKFCKHCGFLLIAKSATQKYHIKCGNIINKERAKKDNKRRSDERKEQKERIYGKIETKD